MKKVCAIALAAAMIVSLTAISFAGADEGMWNRIVGSEPEREAVSEPADETETEVETELESEPADEVESEAGSDPDRESNSESESEPESETKGDLPVCKLIVGEYDSSGDEGLVDIEGSDSTAGEDFADDETKDSVRDSDRNSEGAFAIGTSEIPTPSVDGAEDVTVLMAGLNNILVYWPQNNIADQEPLNDTSPVPVFLVFGDGPFDADSAREYAVETKLDQIAASEGSSVVFVNPVEDTWSDADADVYSWIIDLISNSTADPHSKGITEVISDLTGDKSQKIAGTTERIYVYGKGAGADFVAANILKDISGTKTAPEGETSEFNYTIAGATLEGLSDVSALTPNDIPIVSTGNSGEINAELISNCGRVMVGELPDLVIEYRFHIGKYRRCKGVLTSVLP